MYGVISGVLKAKEQLGSILGLKAVDVEKN
jgi:hypothetical protein